MSPSALYVCSSCCCSSCCPCAMIMRYECLVLPDLQCIRTGRWDFYVWVALGYSCHLESLYLLFALSHEPLSYIALVYSLAWFCCILLVKEAEAPNKSLDVLKHISFVFWWAQITYNSSIPLTGLENERRRRRGADRAHLPGHCPLIFWPYIWMALGYSCRLESLCLLFALSPWATSACCRADVALVFSLV